MWRCQGTLLSSVKFRPQKASVAVNEFWCNGEVSVCRIVDCCEMGKLYEQVRYIRFCEKLGVTQAETISKIQEVFEDNAMSISQIKNWYNTFKKQSTLIGSEPCSGILEYYNRIQDILNENSLSEGKANLPVVMDYNVKWAIPNLCYRRDGKLLPMDVKQLRVKIAQDMIHRANHEPNFPNTVITGQQLSFFLYESEVNTLFSLRHGINRKSKGMKYTIIMTIFFDSYGVVYHEYMPQYRIFDWTYFQKLLPRFRYNVWLKRPELWGKNWQLQFDSINTESLRPIQNYLAKYNITLLEQASFSHDMLPCSFWLVPKLNLLLEKLRYKPREELMQYLTAYLKSFPEDAFQEYLQPWWDRWKMCVRYKGDYVD